MLASCDTVTLGRGDDADSAPDEGGGESARAAWRLAVRDATTCAITAGGKCATRKDGADDVESFGATHAATKAMGFAPVERHTALALVASLLHLGDVEFGEAEDGARGGGGGQTMSVVRNAATADGDALSRAAGLMGVEAVALGDALTQWRIEVHYK